MLSHNLVPKKYKDGFGAINSVLCKVGYITNLFYYVQKKNKKKNFQSKYKSKRTPKKMAF